MRILQIRLEYGHKYPLDQRIKIREAVLPIGEPPEFNDAGICECTYQLLVIEATDLGSCVPCTIMKVLR